jgi:predicted HTH domain antitoxin
MSSAMEKLIEEERTEFAIKLLKNGKLPVEEIAEYAELPIEEVEMKMNYKKVHLFIVLNPPSPSGIPANGCKTWLV